MADIRKFIPKELVVVRDGEWSEITNIYGNLRQVFIIPPSEDTSYTFEIIDDGGFSIYKKASLGSLIDNDLKVVMFPEEKILKISNARFGGIFNLKLVYQL